MSALLFAVAAIATAGAVAMFFWQRGRDVYPDYSIWRGVVGAALSIAAFVTALIPTIVDVGRVIERRQCASFERQTGRDTEFMEFVWGSYDCMVRTERGWVSLDSVMGVEDTDS